MKKRKVLIVVSLVVLLTIVFVGCRHRETYSLLHGEEEIESISIVNVILNDDGEVTQKELCSVADINGFMKKFREVDCYIYFGDPTGVSEEGVSADVIKIVYENGEYELINWNGQAECTDEKGFQYYCGFSVFDENEFKALILEYT